MDSVGVERLAREYDVEIEWVPFELHPEIPPEGRPREEILPAAYMARAQEGVNRLAASVGLHLRLHERLINSRPTLQAAEFAREQGRFDAMHDELMKAYWDDGRDVSDMSVLRDVAARAGVDVAGMEAAVQANRFGDYLDARRQEAEELGISGIPAHVIADRYLVMGAQPYDLFERVMAKLGVPRRDAPASRPS
ncbi:MAG TPA: DsbA family protein [Candidatus Dormibacteraeota bacterium]|nr:DsbA family protein [Candidatus Dormibacteraeota bacterium]